MGRILVIRGGAIGDFVLTLPVLQALRASFPTVEIEVLGYPRIAQLAVAGGLADRVMPIEAQAVAGFFARDGELDAQWAEYFSGFDIIVSYLFDPDQIFEKNVLRCTKAQFIAGPHRPNESEALHATDVFLKPLERLAIFEADATPRLNFTVESAQPLERQRVLAVHPGSGSEKKNWGIDRWSTLLKRLMDKSEFYLVLIGGEADRDRVDHLTNLLPQDRFTSVFGQPLTEVAVTLRSSTAFMGHDSGITHLAAAVGLSGLALWGETNPSVWRPRSERMRLVSGQDGLGGLSVDQVWSALMEGEMI